jgi:hypothetical protein
VIEPDPSQGAVHTTQSTGGLSGDATPAHTLLTSYTYDALNHLTLVSMPRNIGGGHREAWNNA